MISKSDEDFEKKILTQGTYITFTKKVCNNLFSFGW